MSKQPHSPRPRSAAAALAALNRTDKAGVLPQIQSMGTMLFDPVWADRRHRSHDAELLHVIRGKVELELGGAVLPAGPGDTLCVPPNTLHRDRFDPETGLELFFCSFRWPWLPAGFGTAGNRAMLKLADPRKAALGVLFQQLAMDHGALALSDRLAANARLLGILILLLRAAAPATRASDARDTEPAATAGRRRKLLDEAYAYLDRNYAKPLTLPTIAAALGVSAYHLSHVFSAQSHVSLFGYLSMLRMNKAKALLQDRHHTVAEVAYAVGYADAKYFTRVFKKHAGSTPSAYAVKAKRL